MRLWHKSLLLVIVKITGIFYKTPTNLSYLWNFGLLSLFFLLSQIITGIVLAMFYNANASIAFNLIFDLTSEIYYGWWLRNIHANGASFFFLVVYIHICRNIYYGSFMYPRQLLWMIGVIIWVCMIITAFLGYILPWGQMSFWGAMVITSLLGALPQIGGDILFLLWGGFSIDNFTLQRFYSLHYTMPFVILMLSIVHIALLHEYGSSNPLGISVRVDNMPFMPYFAIKDAFSVIIVLVIFFLFVISAPDALGHADNFIHANSLVTPVHIVPEWYFLPMYAVLRCVTNKLLGIFFLACFIVCLLFLPFFCKGHIIRSGSLNPLYGLISWIFFLVCLLLGWIGGLPVMSPYIEIGQILTFIYFFIILAIYPLLGFFEKVLFIFYHSNYK